MRTKTIILGAIAAVALATLSVSAGNAPQRGVQGSATSLVAGQSAIAKADRDAESALVRATSAVKTTTTSTSTETAEKPEVEDEAEDEPAKGPVSPACQTAINNLKALRQADIAEDASEKAGQPSGDEAEDRAEADQAEDKTEAGQFKTARMAVRAACLPQPTAACQAAIDNLKALRQADVAEEAAEKANQQPPSASTIAAEKAEDMAEFQKLWAAFKAVGTACGDRD